MHELMGREDFENLLHSIATALISQTESELQSRSWDAIVLDVRFDHDGGFIDKIRATTSGGIEAISMPSDMMLLLLSLDSLRREVRHDQWYGFRLTVGANKQCEIAFNYDVNCASDPAFYAD
jgi:hypothetical protein